MAGTNADFSAGAFRDAVRFAMNFGAPQDAALRATFRWDPDRTFTVADRDGDPFDWKTAPATDITHADVQIPVAVKYAGQAAPGEGTDAGTFDQTKAVLTVLDEDYATVAGATMVLLGGDTYDIVGVPMPEAVFDVTVWSLVVEARSAA